MSDGPNELMNATVSSGADADPVMGFTQSVARFTSTAPVRPLATFLTVFNDSMIHSSAAHCALCRVPRDPLDAPRQKT